MDILNYTGAPLSSPEGLVTAAGDKWILVYSSGALTNGAIVEVSYTVDAGTIVSGATAAAPAILCVPRTVATSAGEITVVGVVDNSVLGLAGIAAGAFGYVKTQGVVEALVDGTADVAAGDQLEILTASANFINAGAATTAAILPECAAVALVARTTNSAALTYVHLLGRQVQIKGS